MVYRVFTEKKKELAAEARALLNDINTLLQINSVTSLRVINRYDAENITKELFDYAVNTVFQSRSSIIHIGSLKTTARRFSR